MFLKRLHLSSMRLLVVQNHCESPEVRCDGGGGGAAGGDSWCSKPPSLLSDAH